MVSKLEQAREKLPFVNRALASGYVDFDGLDELGQAVSNAIQLINEHEEQQKCIKIGDSTSYCVTLFKPANI